MAYNTDAMPWLVSVQTDLTMSRDFKRAELTFVNWIVAFFILFVFWKYNLCA